MSKIKMEVDKSKYHLVDKDRTLSVRACKQCVFYSDVDICTTSNDECLLPGGGGKVWKEIEPVNAPLSFSEIIDRNYKATVKREKIDQFTNQIDFIDKIKEEIEELRESYYSYHFDHLNGEFDHKELADIALVCFAMAKHYDIDILKVMEEKTLYNETRED